MEKPTFDKEQPKSHWHDAIISERKIGSDHSRYIDFYLNSHLPVEKRNSCLVLGDASQVITSSLVEQKGFKHAVVVDGDPLVQDEYKLKNTDERFEKVLSNFTEYTPPNNTFDFIYGKSIAFIPKEKLDGFLAKLNNSLTEKGLFIAIYAAEGDTFRKIFYTEDELREVYTKNKFIILNVEDENKEDRGLISAGVSHTIKIVATK